MHPSDGCVGGIDAQLHAVFHVFVPKQFEHPFIAFLRPYVKNRRDCKRIRGFLVYDKPVEIARYPVVGVAHHIPFPVFLPFREEDVGAVFVIPLPDYRICYEISVERFILLY